MSSSESVPVAIVGGGPVGLSLALGLARAGVRSVLLERKPTTHEHSRAPAIHVRTREIFRQWGIERTLLEAGTLVQQITLHTVEPGRPPRFTLDFRELDAEADAPGILILEQSHTERLLRAAVQESGYCDLRFGCEAVGLAFHDRGARVEYRAGGDTEQVSAQFVAGCDGASSFVRHALQLPFPGITYSLRPMLADVRIDDARDTLPWPRMRNAADGLTVGLRLAPSLWRLIRLEPGKPSQSDEVPEPELRARVDDVLGPGAFQPVWASRFRIHRRASPRFVVGCVLLAGDAAHVHSPVGGLGMNGGIQDAANLAWKLAAALDGGDSERLLASYETERRAVVVEKVSRYTDLLTRLFLQAPSALREATLGLFGTALRNRWIQRANLRDIGMIGFDYPASPVLNRRARAAGRRLPDVMLHAGDGTTCRLHSLLGYRATLLDVADQRPFASGLPLSDVIRIGRGGWRDSSGRLRALLGGRDGWILVRPDGHVAWAKRRLHGIAEATAHALGR